MEALCRLVTDKHDDIPSTYVPKPAWRSTGKQFLPRIKNHLETLGLPDPSAIDNVCNSSNWGNLNRTGFRAILAECLRRLGISMHNGHERIRRVRDVRNKIVHSLSYLSANGIEELKWPVVEDPQQHFLVACFVDEALLRLFGLGDHVTESWIAGFGAHGPRRAGPSPPAIGP